MKIVVLIKIIGVLTLVSGLLQMVFPTFVLRMVGADANVTSAHFFGIVGMFMALFGGLIWQTTSRPEPQAVPMFWSALQKLGAAVAVPLGVIKGVFSYVALGVAAFDFFSAILIFIYWNHLRKN